MPTKNRISLYGNKTNKRFCQSSFKTSLPSITNPSWVNYIDGTDKERIKKLFNTIFLYLFLSLFKNQDEEIINELKKYQNADGGFGHCLEPDVRMPDSSVLATTRAVIVLHEVKEKRVKIKMIEDIVHYFESQYDNDRKGFYMVSKEVNNYPRAVWWNYEDIDNSRTELESAW